MQPSYSEPGKLAEERQQRLVDFTRRLIQIPSLPGHEGAVAEAIRKEMEDLGYDEVSVDEVGNVIGVVHGNAPGKSVLFNAHMDQVDVGDQTTWPFPPFAATIHDGSIWGRGACDIKGPLASMIEAVGALKQAQIPFQGKAIVSAVVMEETGGLGTRQLVKETRPDFAVIGEPSENRLSLGHRGKFEFQAVVHGRSCHASAPARGINPHYAMAEFIRLLRDIKMAEHPIFGESTVAPTLYTTDQTSANVIPSEARVILDWRNVPTESADDALGRLRPLMNQALATLPGATGEIGFTEFKLRSYTGYQADFQAIFPSFYLPPDSVLAQTSQTVLKETLGRDIPFFTWRFATDGGHTAEAGIPTIGFAPGEERLAHTIEERISIAQITEAMAGYIALAIGLGAAE